MPAAPRPPKAVVDTNLFVSGLISSQGFPAEIIPVAVRDPKDDMILASAVGGKADYLVTGDEDLLVLRTEPALGDLQILTAREFVDRLNRQ